MLILAKSVLALMMGLIISSILGLFIVPLLKRNNMGQKISIYMLGKHSDKENTPTIGGVLFILSTILSLLILFLFNKIQFSYNILIVLFVFISYALIGFLDDYLSIKRGNNEGLTIIQKLLLQIVVATIFFILYKNSGADLILRFHTLNIEFNLGWFYFIFILLLLVGSSNAVNITDGLDGLAGGLSAIAFLSFGLIAWGSTWVNGYTEIAIFCFIILGSLLGFLVYNTYPAKVFMGDTGSLSLGATLATVALLTNHELTLIVIGGMFVIETLTVIIQNISVLIFKKKVFLMTPLHHHFEKLGWEERDIVKLFWIVGFILGMAGIAFGVWI